MGLGGEQEYKIGKEELKKKILNYKMWLDEFFHKEMFLNAIRKFMEMKIITVPLIRELIDLMFTKSDAETNVILRRLRYTTAL